VQLQRFEAEIPRSDNWMAATRFRGGLFRASLADFLSSLNVYSNYEQ
jgi:hypothetical protein